MVKVSLLGLGDIVSLWDGAYSHATVKNVESDGVTVYRVYVHNADFACSSGVICYIGTETVKLSMTGEVKLIKKGEKLR